MDEVRAPRAILVAEDDANARDVLRSVLARRFPETVIYTAGDGRAGLECFRKHLPEIVITDIMMPGMDGIEMSREILQDHVDAAVIVVTGYRDLPSGNDSVLKDLGVKAILWKPVEFREMFAAITACVAPSDSGSSASG